MKTIEWDHEKDCIKMIDQTKLPRTVEHIHIDSIDKLVEAIQSLRVRGAPALGAAGAYGVALSAQVRDEDTPTRLLEKMEVDSKQIAIARPTAVNLSKEVEQTMELARTGNSVEAIREMALEQAEECARKDIKTNKKIGEHGATLLEADQTIMTHCNAGSLATVEWGTALGVVYSAAENGKPVKVITNETRPLNQGSRITTVELLEHDVEATLIPDNASGLCIQSGEVDAVIVGADRVVLNGGEQFGDQAVVYNKVGTYKHAVLANRHDIPFIVAVPTSTIDAESTADEVEIEQRDPKELREIYGQPNAPENVNVYNPAFDATPTELVDYIVTEHGVYKPPFGQELVDGNIH